MNTFKKMDYSKIKSLMEDLYQLNRVHNSDDFELALKKTKKWMEINRFRQKTAIIEYKAGKKFNYWIVPYRWVVHSFFLKDTQGNIIVDKDTHPLALVPFSNSFKGKITKEELLKHVYYRKDLPTAFPFIFRKMYMHWEKRWDIALPHNLVKGLKDTLYEVHIETEFVDKPMQVLEYFLSGTSENIIGLVAHMDHPGQCNDSLSGVSACLSSIWQIEQYTKKPFYNYLILLCPEIVGSAVYVYNRPEIINNMVYCLCPNMLAHNAPLACSRSKQGNSYLDISLLHSLMISKEKYVDGCWKRYPDAGDEISFDAPGINVPTTIISRIGDMFSFYHTSLDSPKEFIQEKFIKAVDIITTSLITLEEDYVPKANFIGNPCLAHPDLNLYLEPSNISNQLNLNARSDVKNIISGKTIDMRLFMDFFLSNIEGNASLLDLAYASSVPFQFIKAYADLFLEKRLINSLGKPQENINFKRKVIITSLV